MGSVDVTVFSIVAILALAVYFVKKRFAYWKDMGVPYEAPIFPHGNIKGIGIELHPFEVMRRIYTKCKPSGAPFCGMFYYLKPVVVVLSLDFIKTVMVRDSTVFCNRGNYYNEEDGELGIANVLG